MKKRLMVGLLAGGLVAAMLPGVATAAANTRSDVELEFNGVPSPHAFINFSQNANGDLRIVVKLWQVPEGADDWYIEVWCGPGHGAEGPALTLIEFWDDQLTTNAQGNGSSGALWIPAADLTAACGSGDRTGHVDVGQLPGPDGSEYTTPAGGLTFTAP